MEKTQSSEVQLPMVGYRSFLTFMDSEISSSNEASIQSMSSNKYTIESWEYPKGDVENMGQREVLFYFIFKFHDPPESNLAIDLNTL